MAFELKSSVEIRLAELRKQHEKPYQRLLAAENDREKLLRELMALSMESSGTDKLKGYEKKLPVIFIFEGRYFLAWLAYHYLGLAYFLERMDQEALAKKYVFFLSPEASDLDLYWRKFLTPERKLAGAYDPAFDPNDPGFNERLMSKKANERVHAHEDDYLPAFRHATVHGAPDYYLSWDYYAYAQYALLLSLHGERYDLADECLFRMKHAVSAGEPPKPMEGGTRLKEKLPALYFYESWLAVRREKDPAARKMKAYAAIYWILEGTRRWKTPLTNTLGDGVFRLCQVLADCAEENTADTEIFRYFKVNCMLSCPTTARKVMAYPEPAAVPADPRVPSIAECKTMYDSLKAKKSKA